MDIKNIKTWGDAIQAIIELQERDKVFQAKLDLAVSDVFSEDRCEACAYAGKFDSACDCECGSCVLDCKCKTCSKGSNWKWRGEE